MQNKENPIKKLGLKETSPGSGVFTCRGSPDAFWKNLTRITREKGKMARSE